MGQVPKNKDSLSYLIAGNGKLSKHFQRYFSLKRIGYEVWERSSGRPFESAALRADKILVLIKDDAIERFVRDNKKGEPEKKDWIHCSGMLSTPLAESAHPMMTFSDRQYDLNFYESIVFITERRRKSFEELFPGLPNKGYEIDKDSKILYHAMCVLSGNFTSFIWQHFFEYLKSEKIPVTAGHQYLTAIFKNLVESGDPLTGPLVRNDTRVIAEHLRELKGHPLEGIYVAFLDLYNRMGKE